MLGGFTVFIHFPNSMHMYVTRPSLALVGLAALDHRYYRLRNRDRKLVQWISSALEFPYPVFCIPFGFTVRAWGVGGRVKQSPARASWWQELQVAAKSVNYSTTRHALTEKTERDTELIRKFQRRGNPLYTACPKIIGTQCYDLRMFMGL